MKKLMILCISVAGIISCNSHSTAEIETVKSENATDSLAGTANNGTGIGGNGLSGSGSTPAGTPNAKDNVVDTTARPDSTHPAGHRDSAVIDKKRQMKPGKTDTLKPHKY